MRDVRDGRDLLELVAHDLEAGGHVLVEQNHQLGLLALHLPALDPARHESKAVQVTYERNPLKGVSFSSGNQSWVIWL